MSTGRPRKTIAVPEDMLPDVPYLTVPEVAKLTGCHVRTIQARLRDGTIKGRKISGEWRIYRESLTGGKA